MSRSAARYIVLPCVSASEIPVTPFPWTDLLVIIGLILINGVFAMSELAIVSARTANLRSSAKKGSSSAQTALDLAADPGKFLSTVQIGITLIAILTGAFSGASLEAPVGERLELLGLDPETARQTAFITVIAITTYLSVVVGELVPKQLALRAASPIAMIMARPMAILAKVAAPIVWILDTTSGLLIRALGIRPAGQSSVTAEELHMLFADATRSGVLEHEQHQMLAGVVRMVDRPVRELMTPRPEVDWIDIAATEEDIRKIIDESPHSLLPVGEGSADKIVGVVKVRDLLAMLVSGEKPQIASLMKRAEVVPDQLDAIDGLRVLQQAEVAMAMVHDEYGHLDGIVTPADLLTAMVGQFASDQDDGEVPTITERADGSYLVSGGLSADALADKLDIEYGSERDFATAAGFVLAEMKRLPQEGDFFEQHGWRFEVVDLDGRRIDKLLVSPVETDR